MHGIIRLNIRATVCAMTTRKLSNETIITPEPAREKR